jgi:hypothetical protein
VVCENAAPACDQAEVNDPGNMAHPEASEQPATAVAESSPLPPPIADEAEPPAGTGAQPCAGDEAPVEPTAEDLPCPEPLPEESPEARILRLRSSLRAAHATGSGRPLFFRLRRALGRDYADQ